MSGVLTVLNVVLAWAKTEAAIRIIMRVVAWAVNWAAKKYLLDRDKGKDIERWAYLARKLSECAGVFSMIVADGVVTDSEANEAADSLQSVLEAWAAGEPTPSDYKDKVED